MAKRSINYPVLSAILLFFLAQCTSPYKTEKAKKDASVIARMECESRQFTHKKFLLADKYSALDNKVIRHEINQDESDSIRRKLDNEKAVLLKESQVKSDSLLHYLRKIWKEDYPSKSDRALLDSLTQIELKKICTLDSP
ncbi:hypothetical protein [Rubrolithibacter danxiaensis]|uniref:hypothetical protein n=1 Tax=Rubrolithibacter danxiaensis TaxID=3390805 RepID=UPI003BF7B3B5